MISVIIPAHNEESVIARGLRCIIEGVRPGELEVIVVCNGCTDRTAEIARGFREPVRVIEIPHASKTVALNAADKAATGYPRFYVDADVTVGLESVRAMAAVLYDGKALLVAPSVRMNFEGAGWLVRAYYNVWTRLPCNQVMVGAGVYGLSRKGRDRFKEFPEVIADDGFVRFRFPESERALVPGAVALVDSPRTLGGLVRIKTRSRLGGYQLRRLFPQMPASDSRAARQSVRFIALRPRLWPAGAVYLLVTIWTKLRALRRLRRGCLQWERDDSRSRVGEP